MYAIRSYYAQVIIDQIRGGVATVYPREWSRQEATVATGRGYVVIPDRREAIRFAVSLLRPGDVLLVAGKGHEDYQILGTTNRITSYNVCYTKLLRVVNGVFFGQRGPKWVFRVSITIRSTRITSYNVCYTKLLRCR